MKNFLEEQYLKNTIFLNERFLEINYIPDKILHRDYELSILSNLFIQIIESPFEFSRKLLIQGPIGVGKTLVTKVFGEMLRESSLKRNINLKYAHINCRTNRTNYQILKEILYQLGIEVPSRGYSTSELLFIIHDFLKKNKIYLFLVLDELNYLQSSNDDLIYALSRLYDTGLNENKYMSLVVIIRDFSLLKNLDDSTRSSLQENILHFKKYSIPQLYDIIKQRVQIAVKPGAFPDFLINLIAQEISNSGDVRKALNIVRNAIKIAEAKGKEKVDNEDVLDAMSDIISSEFIDNLLSLNIHQIIILKALINYIMENAEEWVKISELKIEYHNYCDLFNVAPRQQSQFRNYIISLINLGLIEKKTVSKGQRGTSSYFKIREIPLNLLDKELDRILEKNI